MYRQTYVCTGECTYVQANVSMYRRTYACTDECKYYRRTYVCIDKRTYVQTEEICLPNIFSVGQIIVTISAQPSTHITLSKISTQIYPL